MIDNTARLNKARVLVLNSTYEPLKFQNWKITIHNLWEEVATVIEETHDGELIEARSPNWTIPIPSVIKLNSFVNMKLSELAPYTPANVYIRDNWQCQIQFKGICTAMKRGDLKNQKRTIDHVISQYYGGESSFTNCVACCEACNQQKKYRIHRGPVKPPQHPSWLSIYHKKYIKTATGPAEWAPYLGK